jgi:hypothetical protein
MTRGMTIVFVEGVNVYPVSSIAFLAIINEYL